MPMMGGLLGKMLFVLMQTYDYDSIRTDSNKYCFVMAMIAVLGLISGFF